MKIRRKKILLIGDMPGWAFDNIIKFVYTQLKGEFNFYYDYTIYNPRIDSQVNSDISLIEYNHYHGNNYRKAIPLQRIPILRAFIYYCIRYLNKFGFLSFDEEGRTRKVRKDNKYDLVVYLDFYMDKDADFDHLRYNKKIRGIFTDGFPPKGIQLLASINIAEFCSQYLNDADAIVTGAPSIAALYKKYANIPFFFANMAYNESVFKPMNRSEKTDFVVGWTGNPNREFKGFHSVILPVVDKLQKEGYPVVLKTQFEGSIESLAIFWQDVDLAIIASEADAGPSMFMEASLCGVPSISTRIGMPAYLVRDGENGLFCERNVKDISSKIAFLIDNPKVLRSMKACIRKDYIEKLGVEVQVKNWKNMFNQLIEK